MLLSSTANNHIRSNAHRRFSLWWALFFSKHPIKTALFSPYSEEVVLMTNEQKNQISRLRRAGHGYSAIAQALGISRDAVKSYCRRVDLTGCVEKPVITQLPTFCKQCGKEIPQVAGRKEKKFCSDNCRMAWWAKNASQTGKSMAQQICKGCGKVFYAYPNDGRQYCSHECYIETRFRGGGSREQ